MSTSDPTLTSAAARLPKHDAYMWLALWLEHAPWAQPVVPMLTGSGTVSAAHQLPHGPTSPAIAIPGGTLGVRTGAVVVDAQGRIAALECSGHSHAVARAVLRTSGAAAADLRGADVYVSRFPSPLCTKLMVQVGVRRCFYFPASLHQSAVGEDCAVAERRDVEYASVHRMVMNSAFALTLYLPEWVSLADAPAVAPVPPSSAQPYPTWTVDAFYLERSGGEWARQSGAALARFAGVTVPAFHHVVHRYASPALASRGKHAAPALTPAQEAEARHALVLAHIAARRTDDPKVGVGAVVVYPDHGDPATFVAASADGAGSPARGRYVSVGWNGFPRRSQRNDYSRVGADEAADARDELKYAYVLHAEQNALLFRTPWPGGHPLVHPLGVRMYSTKYPCDECAPLIADAGIHVLFSVPPSSWTVPTAAVPVSQNVLLSPASTAAAAYRGLTYTRLRELVPYIYLLDAASLSRGASFNCIETTPPPPPPSAKSARPASREPSPRRSPQKRPRPDED
ncbi:hypothetical protein H9P43_005690 [Blastocladiella emersonii ATCC 22665]|nr:hypothetical protein H9P43_005690 [Blastocladiella emersonii ATCC 22665]